ncbi:MAG: hypothetical protein EA427_07075 [Spirochaetaceae bacterium]|nr:MAG: hypothetical protein EA427_07075 [Spirochaetaceae bacterium]
MVAEALRLTPGELERLRKNRVAELIGAIPALAECSDADRVAIQHVITYVAAMRLEEIFDHRREDDRPLAARLERISHFPGGNRKIIQRGMDLLTLVMISGYERSLVADRRKGVYNPVTSGVWDIDTERSRLIRAVRTVPSPEMDAILDVEGALRGSWNG